MNAPNEPPVPPAPRQEVLVMRAAARCLDCLHSVGPRGDHRVLRGLVLCRKCQSRYASIDNPHEMSMAMKYEGEWR